MKTRYNKLSIGTLIALFLLPCMIQAQTTNTSYFMKTSNKRSVLNPALRPEQAYLGMPLILNNVYADVKTNSLNMDHLTFLQNGELLSFMHKDVSADKFLSGISPNNYANIDVNYTLFSMGFYTGKGFWDIDLSVKAHADANVPYSAFELMKRGFAMNESSYYNVKDTRVTANGYIQAGVGYSRPFLDNTLVVGAKTKILLGLADVDFHIRDMKIDAGLDEWIIRSHATLQGSAPGIRPKYNEDGDFDTFDWDEKFGISGYGVGFDLGATYSLGGISGLVPDAIGDVLERFTLSMAVTDMGFISWGKKNNSYLYSTLEDEVVTGNFVIDFDNSSSLEDDLDKIQDTLEDIINFKQGEDKNRTTGLRTNLNVGMEYEILKEKLSAGFLSTTRFNPAHTITETTLAVTYRPVKWFETALSYSFIHSKFDTFGLALNFAPTRGVHFFLASDYILPHVNSEFIPVTSKSVNFQLGLSIPLGPRVKN